MNGGVVPADLPADERKRIKQLASDAQIPIVCVGTSARFAAPNEDERQATYESVRRYLDLAQEWDAPLVRVFGGNFPGNEDGPDLYRRVADGLSLLAPDAKQHGVRIALETHDALSRGQQVAAVLKLVNDPSVGACWDWLHPHRMGESLAQTWEVLHPYIIHTHTKDARRGPDGKWVATLFGEGELPIHEMLRLLKDAGYQGPLSLEWEGKDIDPAEVLKQYVISIRAMLANTP